MRTTLKIVLPLIVSVGSVSVLFAAYQVRNERRILRTDLGRSAPDSRHQLHRSASLAYPARCPSECADTNVADQPACPGACPLDIHRAALPNCKMDANAADGATKPVSSLVTRRNHGAVAPRSHAPRQGSAFCKSRSRGRSTPARFECFFV